MILTEYRQLLSEERALNSLVRSVENQPSETADGTKISLLLNAGLRSDTEISLNHLADGVGLYRNRSVCMRTLDVRTQAAAPISPSSRKIPSLAGGGILFTLDHPN